MIVGIFEILVLVTAVSMDAFAAAFAYGVSKIKMPFLSAVIVSGISALVLFIALIAGSYLGSFLPAGFTGQLSFIILFVLGLIKLFDRSGKKEAEEANSNGDNLLSSAEAVALGAALSLDSVAAGIGAGVASMHIAGIVGATLVVNTLMMLLGCRLGKVISGRIRANLAWISGVMLMVLAFVRAG